MVTVLAAGMVSLVTLNAEAAPQPEGALGVYAGTVNDEQFARLRTAGLDPHEIKQAPAGKGTRAVEAVLGHREARRLVRAGVPLRAEQPPATRRRTSAAGAETVFRRYDGPGGIRGELADVAARHPGLTELVTIGKSVRGVDIQAVRVTKDARQTRDGSRPAVLYLGAQHAREWITPEMTRRLMHHVLDGYGSDTAISKLVDTTELWFLPVANPDGYDFTFTPGNRLWRKNLRDNDNDGRITENDGVDLNRNFAEKWGYDNEGSSDDPADQTYRGPEPQSEPETRALAGLFERVGFEFLVNYHSAAQMLLYGNGWQMNTPGPDDQIAVALAGDDAHPAVPGYDPDIAAEMYTSNGDTNVHAQLRTGAIGFGPEMSTCEHVSDSVPDDRWEAENCPSEFEFPDDERLIREEFERHLPFALSVARSAPNPADPVSVVGRTAPALVPDPFPVSYGRNQQVAVIAKRALRGLRLHYRINSGAERAVKVAEWRGGRRYGDGADKYYAEFRGTVADQKPRDRVTAWFAGSGGQKTEPFTYTVAAGIGAKVLVLAAEDVTGTSPENTDGATTARYADEHVAALRHAGRPADVYDLDAHHGQAPHRLGVLSHYRTVVWETGDDIVPQVAGQGDFTTTRAMVRTEEAVRSYLNEGGKLLLAGQYAGYAARYELGSYFRPEGPGECTGFDDPTCLPSGNDFQQYWLGAAEYVENERPAPLRGAAGTFAGFTAEPGDQQHSASFAATSSVLPRDRFPQFDSSAPVKWQPDGHTTDAPYTGEHAVFSGRSDGSYKRLARTVELATAQQGRLRFRTSFDLDAGYDHLMVEAHVVGSDDWTTLPDSGGLTRELGEDCDATLVDQHPFLAHYRHGCESTGSTGTWHAATGNSDGWRDFDADLSAYAGQKVEVVISSVSDLSYQGRGVFIDDVRIELDGRETAGTSFEDGLDGWTVLGPPAQSPPNADDWTRAREEFSFGAGVVTGSTVYLGFGLERLAAADRNDLMARALRHLDG
jgi:hypothetical protein